MEKSCEVCGKQFSVPARLKDVRKHCSAECKHQSTRIALTCKTCGGIWWTWKSQIKIHGRPGAGQFCSKACADVAKRKAVPEKPVKVKPVPIYKSCEVCDKTFRIWPSRKDTARFCSSACKGQSESYRAKCSEQQQGEKSWRWSGGVYKNGDGYIRTKKNKNGIVVALLEHSQVMIEWILEEEPSSLFLVDVDGRKKLHPDVQVHHIDRVRSNNDRLNLLVVTKVAHAQIHNKGKKPEPWECWPSNPTKW